MRPIGESDARIGRACVLTHGMNSQQSLHGLHAEAPAIAQALRTLCVERLLELHGVARTEQGMHPKCDSPKVHVALPAGPLQVTAVCHAEKDHFTQPVARAADEAHSERPGVTIGLFL